MWSAAPAQRARNAAMLCGFQSPAGRQTCIASTKGDSDIVQAATVGSKDSFTMTVSLDHSAPTLQLGCGVNIAHAAVRHREGGSLKMFAKKGRRERNTGQGNYIP